MAMMTLFQGPMRPWASSPSAQHKGRSIRCQAAGGPGTGRLQQPDQRLASAAASKQQSDALLAWAAGKDLLFEQLPVAIQQTAARGRCLVAARDIAADEVVLSVAMEKVFCSQAAEDLEMHWAAEMALRLLQERHRCSSASGSPFWQPWVASLPSQAVTPVEFTDDEVELLVVPTAVQAVLNMRACLEDCYDVLQEQLAAIGCGWPDFLWAVQVLHSRCFFEGSSRRHLAVPGVDMCNHSTRPSAGVRLTHNPGAVQGLQALAEVAEVPPAALPDCSSYMQLVAGPDGIPEGQEISISYGPWPSEPFLLLFGFVPAPNPRDSIIPFTDLQHMAACCLQCAADKLAAAAAAGGDSTAAAALQLLQDAAFCAAVQQHAAQAEQQAVQPQAGDAPAGFSSLVVDRESVDGRLKAALQLVHAALAAAARATQGQEAPQAAAAVRRLQLPLGEVLVHRLHQLAADLEHSSSSLAAWQQQQQQSQASAKETDPQQEEPLYARSTAHAELIISYCSSKAELARQLADGFPIRVAGVFVV